MVFIINGLKKTHPIIIEPALETQVNGIWIAEHFVYYIINLADKGFIVRAIVIGNHFVNVAAFDSLLQKFPGDEFFTEHPRNSTKAYLFFASIQLLKNIRNNLLNNKFVFPLFSFHVKNCHVAQSKYEYLSWSDLQAVYDADSKVDANLRKATKLSYESLHLGRNKQSVNLVLAIFHETTIAACKACLPNRPDVAIVATFP